MKALPVGERITYLFSMSDRSFGYVILLFLTMFLLTTLCYFLMPLRGGGQRITVVFSTFNSLNFLKIQDPVRIRGVEAGQVKNIALHGGGTVVTIEVKPPLDLHRGCRATAVPVGFMGDRCLNFDPGDIHAPPVDPSGPVTGEFLPGPAEAIANTELMGRKVTALSAMVHGLREGSATEPPLPVRFRKIIGRVDGVSVSLTGILRHVDTTLSGTLDSLDRFTERADHFSLAATSALPEMEARADRIITQSASTLRIADSLLSLMNRTLSQLSSFDSGAVAQRWRTLDAQIESLTTLLNTVQQDGLKTRGRL